MWDLHQIKGAFADCVGVDGEKSGHGSYFLTGDNSFEHEFSLSVHMLGLSVAHLPTVYFEHIGEKASAYVLNNSSRVWDNNSTQLKDLGFLYEVVAFPD